MTSQFDIGATYLDTAAGVVTTARAGALRLSFHLYNDSGDVDRALKVLGDTMDRHDRGGILPTPGDPAD